MNRLRSILLSGLVALLMVGMVVAEEPISSAPVVSVDTFPIGGHFGTWYENTCINSSDEVCVKLWISIDMSWLKAIFF